MNKIPLLGYTDRLSGRPGDTINFKVSSYADKPYHARLARVICADPNPAGPGLIEEAVDIPFGGTFSSRSQPFYPGSYGSIDVGELFKSSGSFTLVATIWPTTPDKGIQGIINFCNSTKNPVLTLGIDQQGCAAVTCADANHHMTGTREKLKSHDWYRLWITFDEQTRMLTVGQRALAHPNSQAQTTIPIDEGHPLRDTTQILIAAINGRRVRSHFNGKIESPMIFNRPLTETDIAGLPMQMPEGLQAHWDFSKDIPSTRIKDVGPHQKHGRLINMPARAMTGATWTGEEMSWQHAPDQYAAIYFHDDDIYDFDWETDFSFTIPDTLKSGVYAARLRCGEHEDAVPFFVCPPKGKPSAKLCVLISTFTYTVYGNHARPNFEPSWLDRIRDWNGYPWNPAVHRSYGLSTYNNHSDGSGICHASHKRPLFTLRPGYITFGATEGDCSGLRHFQADSHLITWLEKNDIAYDLVTDQQLHEEGVDAIKDYKTVTTGSHPEYHTPQTLDALQQYRVQGGNFMYLGGNGFYWRVALHPEGNGTIEIRRAEGGIRAWAAEPGEYYQAFDGGYGGLWRRNNRPPQKLAAVGFSAQGNFYGSYYKVNPDARKNPDTAWIFEGINENKLGDFGFSGNGAAGFELDRADHRLGTPEDVHILASSEDHHESFILVPEELLTHITTWAGEPIDDLIKADMVYQKPDTGGQLFATGSITFCGSLLYNDGDNNISKLVGNVLRRFLR
jgi:N,N-dimethylformamidase